MKCGKIIFSILLVLFTYSTVWGINVFDSNYTVETYATYSDSGMGRVQSMAFDDSGNLYLTHPDDDTIWRVDSGGSASVFVSGLSVRGLVWGGGTSYGDYLYTPNGLPSGPVYQIGLDGSVSTFSGGVNCPSPIAIDKTGNYGGLLYTATSGQDHTYSVTTSGSISRFSDFPGWRDGGGPSDIAFDTTGNYGGLMYISTMFSDDHGNEYMSGLFYLDSSGNDTRFISEVVLVARIDFDFTGNFGNKLYATIDESYDAECLSMWKVEPDGSYSDFAETTETYFCDFIFGADGAMYVAEYDESSETITVSKVTLGTGTKTYHVDCATGDNSNDGLSRESAFATIQCAVDAAEDGDRILVWPGVYNESESPVGVHFGNKDLTVKSAADAAVIEVPDGTAVTFANGGNVNFSNFVIRGSGTAILANYCDPVISNVTVVNNTNGLMADNAEPVVKNCIFWNNTNGDLYGSPYAIAAENSWVEDEQADDSLVGHWKLDGNAEDSAGDNDGTVYGAVTTTGQIGEALEFDGVDDYVALPDNDPVWLPENDFTFSCWVRFNEEVGSDNDMILDFNYAASGSSSNETGYCLFRRENTGIFEFAMTTSSNTDENLFSDFIPTKNTWYYIVAIRNGTTQALYINGQLDCSRICSSDSIKFEGGYDDNRINIGKYTRLNEDDINLDGLIDDVRIYNKVLSAEEIEAIYKAGSAGHECPYPLFADVDCNDYHLMSERGRYRASTDDWVLDNVTSVCVDGGDPNDNVIGEPEPNGGIVNMGAYGNTCSASMSEWPVVADLNHDWEVDIFDFSMLTDEWLEKLMFTDEVSDLDPALREWSEPVAVDEINTDRQESSPFLSFDGKSLYFARRGTDGWVDIYEAKRSQPSGPFTSESAVLSLSIYHVLSPWVSKDNLRMYYHDELPDAWHLKLSERTSTNDPWPQGTNVTEINAYGSIHDLSLTEDELIIVFASPNIEGGYGDYDIWMATRANINSSFENITNLSEINTSSSDQYPFISPDGLELYFSSDKNGLRQIFKANRASRNEPFGNIEHLSFLDSPGMESLNPSLSYDGSALYFLRGDPEQVRETDIYVSYFSGPPPYYVDGLNGDNINDGRTESTAFATIQKGINSAEDGDTVVVLPGVYNESVYIMDKEIVVKSVDEPAVIDGGQDDAVAIYNWGDKKAVIKNFIIRNSFAGVYVYSGSPLVENLTIVDCYAGIEAEDEAEPEVASCILTDNEYDLVNCSAEYSWVEDEQDANLVAYWKLDGNAKDSAGDNDGTIYGAVAADGQVGEALEFDGVDDYVGILNHQSLNPTSAITLSVWVKAADWTAGHRRIIQKGESDNQYRLYALGESLSWDLDGVSGGKITAELPSLNEWHNIIGTYDGSEILIFIDSEKVASNAASGDINVTEDDFNIGVNRPDSAPAGDHFSGVIDDVMIFDKALSASEIEVIYKTGLASLEYGGALFANADIGDYHLLSERGRYWPRTDEWVLDDVTSPCVDGGDPYAGLGDERFPNGGRVNMGAYGGTSQASMSEWPLLADLNLDGVVNFEDYADMVDLWIMEPVDDFDPPVPNPMTWEVEPMAVDSNHVYMKATQATDYGNNSVQYYFECVSGSGSSSGWQEEREYTDATVDAGTLCVYKVYARDVNLNETDASVEVEVLVPSNKVIDNDPPLPNPAQWLIYPYENDGYNCMSAVVATDELNPPVWYKFVVVAGYGVDSEWQLSNNWVSSNTGLVAYRVIVCDSVAGSDPAEPNTANSTEYSGWAATNGEREE